MNTLINMNPWALLDELFDTQSRTSRFVRARAAGRFPPANVYLDDHAVMIDLELPGRTAADVDLTLEAQAITIADKKPKAEGAPEPPAWSRRLELPFRVNIEKANAKFTNGILRIELPKAEATGVRKITIQ